MAGESRRIAFGGMMTAVAVVIMSLGSLIPVNTYTCPVLCILLTRPVQQRCGKRIAWSYYMAAALLSLLLAPDREAALVYCFLGYYPLIRPWFQRIRPGWLCNTVKILYFTLSAAGVYGLMAMLFGLEAVFGEVDGLGLVFAGIAVVLWDVMLLMVDFLLGRGLIRKK